jgi:hypothetical protein
MYATAVKASLIGDQQININLNSSLGLIPEAENETPEQASERRRRNEVIRAGLEEAGAVNSDFAYWRKFNNLHGWMERLYTAKGGTECFNCEYVRLMPEDLDKLAKECKTLRPTQGFFYGSYEDMAPEDVKDVKDFIKKARAAIKDGMAVLYSSWW